MRILGIDPGLAKVGFAVLENKKIINCGILKTNKKTPFSQRLQQISQDLEKIINKFKPQKAGIEKLFFVKNITNGISVAHARGVILKTLTDYQIPIYEISPKDAKIAVCGFGNASKNQIQKSIQLIFNLPQKPIFYDSADAIAIAFSISE